jgi:glycosyltransferase involved in cell wall biosynthesis
MSIPPVRVSLVVPTVNRTAELTKLMENLLSQEFKDFEILVVDQNCDDKIVPVLNEYFSRLNIRRIWTPARRGISSAKNDGWHVASGDYIVFADDDCWYPSWFLGKGVELLAATRADLVSGRFADDSGRSINGRYASCAQFITRRSVWITQSEAASFYRRELLERLDGFDEELGIGSLSPWQAAEGPDFVLKALEQGRLCYFDPSLYGFHREFDLDEPGMPRKGRTYGRGMGFVLRRHKYGTPTLMYWVVRPLFSAFIAAIKGRLHRIRYSFSVFLGRLEGMTGHVWAVGRGVDTVDRSAETMVNRAALRCADVDVHPRSNLDLSQSEKYRDE